MIFYGLTRPRCTLLFRLRSLKDSTENTHRWEKDRKEDDRQKGHQIGNKNHGIEHFVTWIHCTYISQSRLAEG